MNNNTLHNIKIFCLNLKAFNTLILIYSRFCNVINNLRCVTRNSKIFNLKNLIKNLLNTKPYFSIGVTSDDNYNTILALEKISKTNYKLVYINICKQEENNNTVNFQNLQYNHTAKSYAASIAYDAIQKQSLALPKSLNTRNKIEKFLTFNSQKLLNINDFSQYYYDYISIPHKQQRHKKGKFETQKNYITLFYADKKLLNQQAQHLVNIFQHEINIVDIDVYALIRSIVFCYPKFTTTAFITLHLTRNNMYIFYVKQNQLIYIKTFNNIFSNRFSNAFSTNNHANEASFHINTQELITQLMLFTQELFSQKNQETTKQLDLFPVVLTGNLITHELYEQFTTETFNVKKSISINTQLSFIFPDFTANLTLHEQIDRKKLQYLCPSLMLNLGLALHAQQKTYAYV